MYNQLTAHLVGNPLTATNRMRSILIICALVTVAAACPTNMDCDCGCDTDINWPSIVPRTWKVKKFDSQYATQALQGRWFLQVATPIYISGLTPMKTGLFSNGYPSVSNRVFFTDTTPEDKTDYNADYYMVDSSFNIITQRVETTRTLFNAAYGSKSIYAIFNVGTPSYYDTPMSDLSPLVDDSLIRPKIGGDFVRDYTVAILGVDHYWNEYMLFGVINKYDNIFCGKDNTIIWLFTRDSNPDFNLYRKAFQDIIDSGLDYRYLISIDQSIDLSSIPTVTQDDIEGIVQTSTTTSSSSKSISTDGMDNTIITSSSTSTTLQTTTSTVDFTLRPDYNIPFGFDKYDLSGDIKILKNLELDILKDALRGLYYITSATPSMYDDYDDLRIGLLNTAGPFSSMQIMFEDSMSSWDVNSPIMMLMRGYNLMDGKVQQVRQIIQPAYDTSNPWSNSVFSIFSEPYYKSSLMTPFTIDGLISRKPNILYDDHYISGIAGYQKDKFLLLNLVNKYKNPLFMKDQPSQFYILSRSRILSPKTIADINQELCRCGYNPRYLSTIDHTKLIEDAFSFDRSYFQLNGSPLLPDSPLNPGYLDNSLTPLSLGNNLTPISLDNNLTPISLDNNLTPISLDNNLTPVSLDNNGISVSPRGLPNNFPLPSIIPPNWNVRPFDRKYTPQAFQRPWFLQVATPAYMNGLKPVITGLFSNCYPSAKNRIIFKSVNPSNTFDMGTEFYMLDSSFNIATQRIETTQTLINGAYGSNSHYSIFNIGTPKYYKNPFTDKYPLNDDTLIRHKLEGDFMREYTMSVLGVDEGWNEYMVLGVVNQYDNLYSGNDHLVWVLTIDSNPENSIIERAYKDILRSGLNPKYLISIDQSLDLTQIPTVTTDDIDGIVQKSVTRSSSSTSISTDGLDTTISTSSSMTTIETTSTVDFIPRIDYTIPYEYGVYDSFGDIKILKNLQPDMIRDAFRGLYYINSATPSIFVDTDDARVGLLNTAFPASSLQLMFDDSTNTPWNVDTRVMMLDRGYNMINNKMQQTRNIIQSTYDGSVPWGVFTINSEGYYPNPITEISPFNLNGVISKKISDLYRDQYYAGIVGYQKEKFLILNIANKFQNKFYSANQPNGLLYVMTRDRILSANTIADINQEILRSGYNPKYLVNIDQTRIIEDAYSFDSSYFQFDLSSSSMSSSSSITIESSGIEIGGSTITTSSSSSSYSMTSESSSGLGIEIEAS